MSSTSAALETLARDILDTAQDAYVCMDASGRVVEWSGSAERLTGFARADALDCELAELVLPAGLRSAWRSDVLRFLESGDSRIVGRDVEIAIVHRDGHELPVQVSASVLRSRTELFFNLFVRDLRSPSTAALPLPTFAGSPAAPAGLPTLPADDEIADAIRRTISGEQDLRIVVQPIVDLGRGFVTGYEALSRFTGPPNATPDVWFEAAARLELSGALEAVAIRRALDRRAELPPNCFLTVNVSPLALEAAEVRDVFAQAGSLGGVIVELTEQTVVSDYDLLATWLDPLRSAGALIAVDDAGAGYASLRHVLGIRPDLVKLDRSLAAGVDRDPAKAAVVEMLGGLAGRLDAWMLAEGIETEGELEALLALGVPLGQGYFLSRPADDFEALRPELGTWLADRRSGPASGLVATLVESVATVGVADGVEAVPADQELAVVVDESGRPLTLVRRGPAGVLRSLGQLMTVLPQETAKDVALRAMARPEHERFDAIACHDAQGALLGLVRMERLVAHLAAPS